MSLSFATNIYSQPNREGSSVIFGVGTNDRYSAVNGDQLKSQSLYGSIESVDVLGSTNAESNVFLFTNDDFSGQFLQMIDARSAGEEWYNISGQAHSLMLIAGKKTGKNEIRISFRDQFLTEWDTFLDSKLSGTQASRVGDPTLTWEMFPQGMQYLNSNLAYLKIYQPLHISLPWYWPDYWAAMTYYLYLYITDDHHLRASGVRADSTVEGGAKNGKIHNSLDPEIFNGLSSLQDKVNTQFEALDALGSFTDVYYLPGHQVTDIGTGSATGNTTDDVTIVIEH